MDPKGKPTTLRIAESVEEYVAAEAGRTRRTKAAVYESLLEEAVRCRLFPGIAFRGSDWQREPWVVSAGLDVWEIIQAFRQSGEAVERVATQLDIPDSAVRLAFAYYARFPEDIDRALRENSLSVEELRSRFPAAAFA